jgi:hypothetical protein
MYCIRKGNDEAGQGTVESRERETYETKKPGKGVVEGWPTLLCKAHDASAHVPEFPRGRGLAVGRALGGGTLCGGTLKLAPENEVCKRLKEIEPD